MGHSATINPAEGGEYRSLTRTTTTTGKVVTTATSVSKVVATTTDVVDKSCARAVAVNDKAALD